MTGFAKMCLVHTCQQFFNFENSQNLLQMSDWPEICRVCKVTIPLLFLQILDLHANNEQNQMCELCMQAVWSYGHIYSSYAI